MRIFVFLIFFCLQKNTFLTEFINGVFNFSRFAFFQKLYSWGFPIFCDLFYLKKIDF